ncbi:hypothetical protein [Chlorobium sp. N1]|uniref:hypothetical protein n=1 Tax=Chlorobium sp. N1 TaxID=2491138 RepID=UPI0013F15C24|nr:hypothetical protein [Chlorobium sp. N1]
MCKTICARSFRTAKTSLVMVLVASFLMATVADAAEKTFIRDYRYRASDKDSKVSSRDAALEQVTALLLKETGAYVESTLNTEKKESETGVSSLTKEDITAISAGVTKTQILEESWDGKEYYVKAEIMLDPDEIQSRLDEIEASRRSRQLEQAAMAAAAVPDVHGALFNEADGTAGAGSGEMAGVLTEQKAREKKGVNVLFILGGLALVGGIVALAAGGSGGGDSSSSDGDDH